MQIWGTVSNVLHVGREPSTLIGLWPRSQKNAKKKEIGPRRRADYVNAIGFGFASCMDKKKDTETEQKQKTNETMTSLLLAEDRLGPLGHVRHRARLGMGAPIGLPVPKQQQQPSQIL